MATPIEQLKQRSSGQISSPVPVFVFEPFPKKLVVAFPELADWHTRQNAKIAAWVKTLNLLQGNVNSAVVALQN